MVAAANINVIQTTGMKQIPISHPPIACCHDIFGAATIALQIAKTINDAQRAIIQRQTRSIRR